MGIERWAKRAIREIEREDQSAAASASEERAARRRRAGRADPGDRLPGRGVFREDTGRPARGRARHAHPLAGRPHLRRRGQGEALYRGGDRHAQSGQPHRGLFPGAGPDRPHRGAGGRRGGERPGARRDRPAGIGGPTEPGRIVAGRRRGGGRTGQGRPRSSGPSARHDPGRHRRARLPALEFRLSSGPGRPAAGRTGGRRGPGSVILCHDPCPHVRHDRRPLGRGRRHGPARRSAAEHLRPEVAPARSAGHGEPGGQCPQGR